MPCLSHSSLTFPGVTQGQTPPPGAGSAHLRKLLPDSSVSSRGNACRQTDRQTDRQTGRQTDRQADRQTARETLTAVGLVPFVSTVDYAVTDPGGGDTASVSTAELVSLAACRQTVEEAHLTFISLTAHISHSYHEHHTSHIYIVYSTHLTFIS